MAKFILSAWENNVRFADLPGAQPIKGTKGDAIQAFNAACKDFEDRGVGGAVTLYTDKWRILRKRVILGTNVLKPKRKGAGRKVRAR